MNKYTIEKKLGNGTCIGSVFLVHRNSDAKTLALKQIRVNLNDIENGVIKPSREYNVNSHLLTGSTNQECCYFVNMVVNRSEYVDQFYTERKDSNGITVLEYVESTLAVQIVHHSSINKSKLIRDLIQEVAFLHEKHTIHRDLKPSNILLYNDTLSIKLCDFGCSKIITTSVEKHRSTPLVTSRFYRAPEILMGATQYAYSIDIWSLGCGTPLFTSLDSDAEQLLILGTPSEEDLVKMQIPKSNRERLSPMHLNNI